MKIIIAAQNYGFCPTSYAFTIARALQNARVNIDIAIIETSSVKTFKQLNEDTDFELIAHMPVVADLVISCYDTSAIFEAWLNNIPCLYYCNLLWFWLKNGELDLGKITVDVDLFKQLKKDNKISDLREIFNKKCQDHPISGMMYGYFLANKSFCRKFPGYEEAIKQLPCHLNAKVIPLSIFMPYKPVTREKRKNLILFQLSGSENPHTNYKQNEIYIRGCYHLALALSQKYQDLEFIFCVNPAILEKLCSPLANRANLTICHTVSQKEQFNLLSEVKALFIPPGLGTTYEALYSGTPFFYLPEQNIGQHPNWKLLKEMGIDIAACLVNEEFPDSNYIIKESFVENLYRRIELLFSHSMKHIINLASSFLEDQVPNWSSIHAVHMAKFKEVMGNEPFLVGDEIAEVFLSTIPHLKYNVSHVTFTRTPKTQTIIQAPDLSSTLSLL